MNSSASLVVTREAELAAAGNAGIAFPIQSISKVFALEIALEAMGEKLWQRMGREPSGDPFNSIIDLERDKGIPRNPLVNAGALVVCDILSASAATQTRTGMWYATSHGCSTAKRSTLILR